MIEVIILYFYIIIQKRLTTCSIFIALLFLIFHNIFCVFSAILKTEKIFKYDEKYLI